MSEAVGVHGSAGLTREGWKLIRPKSRDVEGLFDLAAVKLVGKEEPRDVIGARRLLREAVEQGSEDAALLEVALTANGTGAPADWSGALARLRSAAKTSGVARAQLDLLGRMNLDVHGRPVKLPTPRRLSSAPDVLLFSEMLSRAECAHVAAASADLLRPAVVVHPITGRETLHPVRRSDAAVIGPAREDLVIGAINRRIAAATATSVEHGEPLAILRYRPGQEYRTHHDALPGEQNRRVRTAIVYLSDAYAGGATRFDVSGLEVRGAIGDVLVFGNVTADGTPDPAARHAGLPVHRGEKWIATRWIRARPLDPWSRPREG